MPSFVPANAMMEDRSSMRRSTSEDKRLEVARQPTLRRLSKEENMSQNSLLSVMDSFMHAVDQMDNAIMIPHRLMDIPQNTQDDHEANLTTSDCNMNGRPINQSNNSNNHLKTPADLYGVYNLLKTVKKELVRGQEITDEDEDEVMDEQYRKVTTVFRQHLNGLFTVLHQLTDAANFLQGRYQQELGEPQVSLGVPSFTV